MSAIVAFVLGDARHDSRVLREAATLAAAGHDVTLVARTDDPLAPAPTIEPGPFTVIRIPLASGLLRWLHLLRRPGRLPGELVRGLARDPGGTAVAVVLGAIFAVPGAVLGAAALVAAVAARRVPAIRTLWRTHAWRLSWWLSVGPWARRAGAEAARVAPGAAIAWAHDLRALPAARQLRDRLGGRPALVYDAHEIFPEAGDHATRPPAAKAAMAALERRLAGDAAALVTVNGQLAERLGPALGIGRVVVARNCPPRWTPPGDGPASPSPLRAAAGVPAGAPILLYHGGLAPGRGIEALAAALRDPRLARAHLVFMGSGPSHGRVAELVAASDGRIHLLPPVSPDVLLDWVAGADVAVAPIEPTTLNHRLSSPNKVFEAIAAGVPVVGSDLPGIREVVLADPAAPLGVLVDPADPADIARGVAEVLDRPDAARADLRARCLAAARDRWCWEVEGAGLLALAADLGGLPAAEPRAAASAPVPQRVAIVLPTTGEHDARTRRLATDLLARGHAVTIVARASEGAAPGGPATEAGPSGARWVRVDAGPPAAVPAALRQEPLRLLGEGLRVLGVARQARRQARAAGRLGLEADLVHAMGFLALPVARAIAGPRRTPLVYDARDLYLESNNLARLPGPVRAAFAAVEGRWARDAARLLTVNESLAEHLARRYGVRRPEVVMNGQRAWTPPETRPDRLRAAAAIDAATPVALYHGGFMPDRGLPELIAAWADPRLAGVAVILMGSGGIEARLRDLAAASPARDRIHILPPVAPAELPEWVASADLGLMPNQPRTLNERLSTPNKLFECLAAGTPVVSSDFPERRRIVLGEPDGPLGALCDPTDPAAIAAAVRSVLDLAPPEAAALRARCLRAARERYGWERQVERALAAYSEITGHPW